MKIKVHRLSCTVKNKFRKEVGSAGWARGLKESFIVILPFFFPPKFKKIIISDLPKGWKNSTLRTTCDTATMWYQVAYLYKQT